MTCIGDSSNINQTFIIEPLELTGGSPTLSACTTLFTNAVVSCSGDTQILMETGIISFTGNLYTNNELTATTINASTYYSGGTNLFNIIDGGNITGGTFNKNDDTLSLYKTNGNIINVTGLTDYYTTGTTLIGDTVYFNRVDTLSAYTLNLSKYSADTYVTGVTFNNNQLLIVRNDNVGVNTYINSFTGLTINGILSADTIYSNSFSGNSISGNTIYLSGVSLLNTFIQINQAIGSATTIVQNGVNTYTGGTTLFPSVNVIADPIFNSLSANTISATTFYGNGSNLIGVNFTGGTVTGSTNFTNGLTANTISATTYYNLPKDVYITGGTYSNGTTVFTNNTGGTFNVTGYYTGTTDIHTTGFTYLNNTFTIKDNVGNNFSTSFNIVTGLTVNGVFSATTYQGLPIDITVTGGTYSNGTTTFTNNTGGTFNINGFFKTSDDIHTTGVSINNSTYDLTIYGSDGINYTTNLGILATDVSVTGGTYDTHTGIVTFTNNTGGTFNVSGFTTGITDTRVSNFTYNNANIFTITDSSGGTFNSIINTVTGLTVNGILSATTFYGDGSHLIGVIFTGGTVTGSTNFTNGLSANIISATTYQGLPIDINVTGGTYSNGTATFTNNTGGTFNVTGFSTNNTTSFTGGTVTGTTIFTNGLTTNTISATTYYNLPKDIWTTGATYSNNQFIYKNNTGGTFNVLFNTLTGLTVNGGLIVTGNTKLNNITGATMSLSGSGRNILVVSGTSGEIFNVSDSSIDPLLTVSDIYSIPTLQVFSGGVVTMGSSLAPSYNTSVIITANTGTTTIISLPLSSGYTGAFFNYTINNSNINYRAGNIMSIWNTGTTVQFSETSTNDIGDTNGVTFNVTASGGTGTLNISATTNNWIVKTVVIGI